MYNNKAIEDIINFFTQNIKNESIFQNLYNINSAVFLNDTDYSVIESKNFIKNKYKFYKNFLKKFELFANKKIKNIAVDGAFENLYKFKIKTDLIIGDIDSYKHIDQDQEKKIIYLQDQEYCDFEKSLEFLNQNNLSNSFIFGINSGAFDRIIQNIHVFLKFSNQKNFNIGICLNKIFFSIDSENFWQDKINIYIKNHSKISMFFFPDKNNNISIETDGLKWDVKKNTNINFGIKNSSQSISNVVENHLISENDFHKVSLKVFEGKVLLIIYF
jgi:thiamine pyrophosphokinase